MDCVFCNIAEKKLSAWIVYEDKEVIAFFDKGSATKGHTLIVPKKHYENIYDISPDLLQQVTKVSKDLAVLYKEKLNANAVNLVHSSGKDAGQDVFHFHLHLIPRYKEDGINQNSWWRSSHRTGNEFDEILKQIRS